MKFLITGLLATLILLADVRDWTNKETGTGFAGEYVSQTEDEVSIKRSRDGKEFSISKKVLIDEDWEWLHDKAEAEKKEAAERVISGDYMVTDKEQYQIDIKLWFRVNKEAAGHKFLFYQGMPVSGGNVPHQRVLAPSMWKMESEQLGTVDWEEVKTGMQEKYELRQYGEGASLFRVSVPEGLPEGSLHRMQFRHFVELGRVKFKSSIKRVPMEALEPVKESEYGHYFPPYEEEWPKPALLEEILGSKEEIAKRTIYENMHLIYEGVLERMEYISPVPDRSLQALSTEFKGDCGCYGKLISALGRQAGIPCRVVSGFTFFDKAKFEEKSDNRLRHAWGEFFVPNYGWAPFDGSFGDKKKVTDDFFARMNDKDGYLRLVNKTHKGTQTLRCYYKVNDEWVYYRTEPRFFGGDYYYTIEVSKYRE